MSINSTQGQKYFKTDWITNTANLGATNKIAFLPITGFSKKDDLAPFSKLRVCVKKTASGIATSPASGYLTMVESTDEITEVTYQNGILNSTINSVAPAFFQVSPSSPTYGYGTQPSTTTITGATSTEGSMFDISLRQIVFECGGIQGYPALAIGVQPSATGGGDFIFTYRVEGWA